MCFNWFGSSTTAERINYGSLAVIAPILEQMDLAGILDRHLPQDPQAEFSAGSILSLLVAARLSNPVALVNVADWAQQSGADLVWKIPPEKLNDDRLGRALDAFYYQRHSILASIAMHVAETFDISLQRLHYDPTAIFFHGTYAASQPRDDPAVDRRQSLPPTHAG
jgi:transposase